MPEAQLTQFALAQQRPLLPQSPPQQLPLEAQVPPSAVHGVVQQHEPEHGVLQGHEPEAHCASAVQTWPPPSEPGAGVAAEPHVPLPHWLDVHSCT